MKVHYAKKIIEKIEEEKRKADRQNREIEFIELNDKEWIKLKREVKDLWVRGPQVEWSPYQQQFYVGGVLVCKEAPLNGYGMGKANPNYDPYKEDF